VSRHLFAILLEGIQSGRDAFVLAKRIEDCLRDPIRVDDREVSVTASIGISISGQRALSARLMLRNADAAMYAPSAPDRRTSGSSIGRCMSPRDAGCARSESCATRSRATSSC
jgi:GGDEF domain-containing protein